MSIRTTVKPFRITLNRLARRGVLKLRIVKTTLANGSALGLPVVSPPLGLPVAGSAGGTYALAVQRGKNLFLVRAGFPTPTAANIHAMMNYGRKATRLAPHEMKGMGGRDNLTTPTLPLTPTPAPASEPAPALALA